MLELGPRYQADPQAAGHKATETGNIHSTNTTQHQLYTSPSSRDLEIVSRVILPDQLTWSLSLRNVGL